MPSSDTEDTNEVAGGDFENDDKADPGGYDNIVRNLLAKRVKRSKRKRVGGWASRVLQALVASVAAMATQVMSEAKKILIDPMADYSDHIDKISRPEDLPEGPALLEIFAGSAHLTMEFAKQGYTVLEPRDILLGHDLRLREEQESVLGDIQARRPRLLRVGFPCTKWSPWQRLNYVDRGQELRRERRRQRELVRFAVQCAELQLELGGDIVFEHPKYSDMWGDQAMRPMMTNYWTYVVELDMCRYGLRAKSNGGLHRKPTSLLVSGPNYGKWLGRTCKGGHEHTPTAGQDTKAAGVYSQAFCRAVVKAFADKSGNGVWDSYPAHVKTPKPRAVPATELHPGEVHGEDLDDIEVDIGVPRHQALALKRLDQNVGHPSNVDLARHLKLAGAGQGIITGAHRLRCATCQRSKRPGTRRPARLLRQLDFNQEVVADTMHLYDGSGNKVSALSILDLASGYHVVRRLSGGGREARSWQTILWQLGTLELDLQSCLLWTRSEGS